MDKTSKSSLRGLVLFALAFSLGGCSEENDALSWSLGISSEFIKEDVPQTPLTGIVRYEIDGKIKEYKIENYKLPTSGVVMVAADEVLEINIDPVEYPHPVYFHLVRNDNLHEIKWPEEAHKAIHTRFLYERVEHLKDGFVARGPFAGEKVNRTLPKDALRYARANRFTKAQFDDILTSIEPEIKIS
ncbi:MAG: hypothetical protein LAT58_10540 [Opitutales bacterium]|nr:hypothetical protein [Opitutales bacterium]